MGVRIDKQICISTSSKLGLPLDVVEAILGFQYKEVLEAMDTCNVVEISGLMVLRSPERQCNLKIRSLQKRLEIMADELSTCSSDKIKSNLQKKRESCLNTIKYLRNKIQKHVNKKTKLEPDNRGLEEPPISKEGD